MSTTADREALARLLYEMNGHAWYGRDLGDWNDPTSRIGDPEGERRRWLRQADQIIHEASDTVRLTTNEPTEPRPTCCNGEDSSPCCPGPETGLEADYLNAVKSYISRLGGPNHSTLPTGPYGVDDLTRDSFTREFGRLEGLAQALGRDLAVDLANARKEATHG